MDKHIAEILLEIEQKSSVKPIWNQDEFYQEIVRGYFIPQMGYETGNLCIKECSNTFQKSNLMIKGAVEKKYKKELQMQSTN